MKPPLAVIMSAAAGALVSMLLAPWLDSGPPAGETFDVSADSSPSAEATATTVTRPAQQPRLDDAVRQVGREVSYISSIVPDAWPEYIAALAVNSYVVGHVSAPAYGYLDAILKRPMGVDASLEEILEHGAGVCGEATSLAVALYTALGVPARRVIMTYPDGGHTTVEVGYGDSWHWFDPTFGYFYEAPDGRVYSVAEALSLTPGERAAARVGNDSLLWSKIVRRLGTGAAVGLDVADATELRVELESGEILYER